MMCMVHKIHSDSSYQRACCSTVSGRQCDCCTTDLPILDSVIHPARDKDKFRNLLSSVTFTGNESCRLISYHLRHFEINCLQFNEVFACLKIRTKLNTSTNCLTIVYYRLLVTLKFFFLNCKIVCYINYIRMVLL